MRHFIPWAGITAGGLAILIGALYGAYMAFAAGEVIGGIVIVLMMISGMCGLYILVVDP